MKIPNSLTSLEKWQSFGKSAEFQEIRGFFASELVFWFDANKRDLPWRHTQDPYKILLSELMLQQTQVDRVIDFYNVFLQALPDFSAVAKAPEEQILELWGGLGYYNRARNLQKIAKIVTEQMDGQFPITRDEILALPGIGEYTAGAVMTFALHIRAPIVDTNVDRVYDRVFLDGIKVPSSAEKQKIFWFLAEFLLPEENFWEFNQGIMDFGAMQCTVKSPRCKTCPFSKLCRFYSRQSLNRFFR